MALCLGAELSAYRAGIGSAAKMLAALKALTGAKIATLVECDLNSRPRQISSTAGSIELTIALKDDFYNLKLKNLLTTSHDKVDTAQRAFRHRQILPLDRSGSTCRAIVLHHEDGQDLSALKPILQDVSAIWAASADLDGAALHRQQPEPDPIGQSRNWDLTAAEFRVCDQLRQGKRPAKIAESLGVSITTVRTHLRHIYAKADCDGLISLQALLSSAQTPRLQDAEPQDKGLQGTGLSDAA